MSFHRALAVSSFLLIAPLSYAFAQDATVVGERLKSGLARQGTTLTFDTISGDAVEMIIEGAKVSIDMGPAKIEVGDITLADIREEAGNFIVGSVTLPDYSHTEDGITVVATGIGFTNMRLPPQYTNDPVAGLLMYDTADVENVSVKFRDKQVFNMDRLHLEIDAPAGGKPLIFSGAADRFSADLSFIDDPNFRKLITALDLQTLTGTYDLAGYWQPGDGRLAFEQHDISIDKVGRLGLTFDLRGYTPDFIKSAHELEKSIAADPARNVDRAQGLAIRGLLQRLTFRTASIRFDDNSLTGRVIDYLADQQKVKAGDMANQAKGLLPFIMTQFNAPELTAQTIEAASTYLDDPKSIEISAKPENPVPFAMIMAAFSQSRNDLIKALGISVTANEPARDNGEDIAE